eukprot:SAG11_NODE_285_length_11230_cov_6.339412_9_plen_68_part_00
MHQALQLAEQQLHAVEARAERLRREAEEKEERWGTLDSANQAMEAEVRRWFLWSRCLQVAREVLAEY